VRPKKQPFSSPNEAGGLTADDAHIVPSVADDDEARNDRRATWSAGTSTSPGGRNCRSEDTPFVDEFPEPEWSSDRTTDTSV